jgi:hypothetical protein
MSLVQGTDGKFYGTNSGIFTDGGVFRATSGGTLTELQSIALTEATLVQAPSGDFYGTTNPPVMLICHCASGPDCWSKQSLNVVRRSVRLWALRTEANVSTAATQVKRFSRAGGGISIPVMEPTLFSVFH